MIPRRAPLTHQATAALTAALAIVMVGCGASGDSNERADGVTVQVRVAPSSRAPYRYFLSRDTVPTGDVTFNVVNRTNARIDFKIDDYGTPTLAPGARFLLHARLDKPGRYVYFGSGQYAEMGLEGVLTVR